MADRKVTIALAVDASDVESGSRRSQAALKGVGEAAQQAGNVSEKASEKAAKSQEKATKATLEQEQAASKVGNALMIAGTAAIGAAAAMAKSAIDWESAFAGVRKTVDGSASEMAELEGQLRQIARTAPASHKEIAAVAEAAGQLGVAREDVAKFSKVMIDLGVTTNLTADEAATSIRQFMNIMGSAPDSVDRIGAAIVGLGNKSATTERDIVAMAQRLAGAGRQARLSESDVLGMAAAMASVGIEAEAGGTAMSLTIKKIDEMVREGGNNLGILGHIAGMTGDAFAKAWGRDAAKATATLIEGLGRMSAAGKDVNGVLNDLGFKGIRQSDTLLRLAGATKAMGAETDLLSKSLRIGAEEFARNEALAKEAAARYGTTAEKAKIALNQIRDGAIDMGQALLPMVADGIQLVSNLAQGFAALPDPLKSSIGVLSGLSGILLLSAGGAVKLTLAAKSARDALENMGTSLRNVSLKGGLIGGGLALAVAVLGHYASESANAAARSNDLAQAIQSANGQVRDQNGLINENVRAVAAKNLAESGALDIARQYGIDLALVTEAYLGNAEAAREVEAAVTARNKAMAESGAFDEASAEALRENAEQHAALMGVIREGTSATNDAIEKSKMLAEATGKTAEASQSDVAAKQEQAQAIARARAEMQAMIDAATEAAEQTLRLSGSQIGLESAIAAAEKTISKNKKTLDLTTEAGRENQKALDNIAASSIAVTKAMASQGAASDEITAATKRGREAWERHARQLGMSEEKVKEFSAQLFAVPAEVSSEVKLHSQAAKRSAEEWRRIIAGLPVSKQTEIQAALDRGDVAAAEAALNRVARSRTAHVKVAMNGVGPLGAGMRPYATFATGGLVRDLPNRHVAHIAPAGAWRVFAEPETKGEAYIPLANDWRRPRAQQILRETAQLIGVQTFATGGVVTPPVSRVGTTGSSVVVGDVIVHAAGVTVDDVARELSSALSREIRANGLGG